MIFVITFSTISAFAQGDSIINYSRYSIGEGVTDVLGKIINFIVGILLGIFIAVLWIVSRLLSFVFNFLGGIVYGFFIKNPLDTELSSIRPLWSFLVDFGNLIIVGSFLALAIAYLFNVSIPGMTKDVGKFFTSVMIIALLMNFSLTFTSAIATTIHNIGIGSLFLTLGNNDTAKLDLSSKKEFNKSLTATGNTFFQSISGNFINTVSCVGGGEIKFKGGSKKMSEVCNFHKKDFKDALNPLTIISSADGTPESINFFLTAIIREFATIILLGCAIWVMITLLKVAVFRLAYLWLVGIFSGPALVAALSPFPSLKKYFGIWLKYLITFSTMMIVFIFGFYLSSYVAQIAVDTSDVNYEALPNILDSPGYFVTVLVNNMIQLVVPNIMFPIIGLAVMYLLGKYLSEVYMTQAKSVMDSTGKMVGNAYKGVKNAAGMPGRAVGAVARTAGNVAGLAAGAIPNVRSALKTTQGRADLLRAGVERARGNSAAADQLEAMAISKFGSADVSKQRAASRVQKVKDMASMKGSKQKEAEMKYLGQSRNAEMIKAMGGNDKAFEEEARKAGVSESVINQGRDMRKAYFDKMSGVDANGNPIEIDSIDQQVKTQAASYATDAIKKSGNYSQDFESVKNNMLTQASAQLDTAQNELKANQAINLRDRDATIKALDEQDALINAGPRDASGNLSDKDQKRINANQSKRDSAESSFQKKNNSLEEDHQVLSDNITSMQSEIQSSTEDIDEDNIINQALIAQAIEDDPSISKKAAADTYDSVRRNMDSAGSVEESRNKSKAQAGALNASANLLFSQLKAIEKMETKSVNGVDVPITKQERKSMQQAIIDTVLESNKPESQEVVKRAQDKLNRMRKNPYDNS